MRHSLLEREGETLILVCAPHFEMILSDKKRSSEAFEIVRRCGYHARSYDKRFDETVAPLTPYGLEQQRQQEQQLAQQQELRQTTIGKFLDNHEQWEEAPIQTSSHS